MKIKNIPVFEQPRERCLKYGPSVLSLRECLALLINSGSKNKSCLELADEVLTELSIDFNANFDDNLGLKFKNIKGLGPALQTRLLAALELAKRLHHQKINNNSNQVSVEPIQSLSQLESKAFAKIGIENRFATNEWIGFVGLLRTGKLTDFIKVQEGGSRFVQFDSSDFFLKLLLTKPFGFFIFHNHPNADLQPSRADQELTLKIKKTAQALNLEYLGHGIVARNQVYYF